MMLHNVRSHQSFIGFDFFSLLIRFQSIWIFLSNDLIAHTVPYAVRCRWMLTLMLMMMHTSIEAYGNVHIYYILCLNVHNNHHHRHPSFQPNLRHPSSDGIMFQFVFGNPSYQLLNVFIVCNRGILYYIENVCDTIRNVSNFQSFE